MIDGFYTLSKTIGEYVDTYRDMQRLLKVGVSMSPQMYGEALQKKKTKKRKNK